MSGRLGRHVMTLDPAVERRFQENVNRALHGPLISVDYDYDPGRRQRVIDRIVAAGEAGLSPSAFKMTVQQKLARIGENGRSTPDVVMPIEDFIRQNEWSMLAVHAESIRELGKFGRAGDSYVFHFENEPGQTVRVVLVASEKDRAEAQAKLAAEGTLPGGSRRTRSDVTENEGGL